MARSSSLKGKNRNTKNDSSTNASNSSSSGSGSANSAQNNTDGDNQSDFYNGMFNLSGLMEAFYGYTPNSNDEVGNAIKNTFASNMIQSAFDQQMAMQMADYQANIGTQNMQTAASLELNNNSKLMQQEFEQGMQTMGAQFDYQNTYANAQYDRDIGMLGATGEQTRKNQDNAAFNERQKTIVAGEQQRLNTALQGGIDIDKSNIAADASKYGAQVAADASKYSSDASVASAGIAADASRFGATESRKGAENVASTQAEASKFSSTQARAASEYGSDQTRAAAENVATTQAGAQVRSAELSKEASTYGADRTLEGVKDTNTTSTRNIRTTGDETRKNAAQANTFDVDRERRQQARSRAGARRY